MPADMKAKRQDQYVENYTNYDCIKDALAITKQFLEPTEYVTILPGK